MLKHWCILLQFFKSTLYEEWFELEHHSFLSCKHNRLTWSLRIYTFWIFVVLKIYADLLLSHQTTVFAVPFFPLIFTHSSGITISFDSVLSSTLRPKKLKLQKEPHETQTMTEVMVMRRYRCRWQIRSINVKKFKIIADSISSHFRKRKKHASKDM